MESSEAYLKRKHQELRLLNDCLEILFPFPCPRSLSEVIKHKFQLAAALKAEHALQDWTATETAWSQAGHPPRAFEFRYHYQRADLEVQGPSPYELRDGSTTETIYTASGMAAISALLFASANVIGRADVVVLPGSYGETIELVGYVRPLRLVTLNRSLDEVNGRSCPPRIFLLEFVHVLPAPSKRPSAVENPPSIASSSIRTVLPATRSYPTRSASCP